MKNAAAGSTVTSGNSRWGGMWNPGPTFTAVVTLAAVFAFYTMLAITFGIGLRWGCILAAAGAATVAWIARVAAWWPEDAPRYPSQSVTDPPKPTD